MPTPGALPASWGRRFLAFVIDLVAAALLGGAFVVAGVVGLLTSDGAAPAEDGAGGLVLLGAAMLVVLGVAQWWLLGARGVTLGKRLAGLRLLDVTTGRPVGLGRALLRGVVPLAAGVLPVVGSLAVWLSPFADPSGLRRGWHDRAARAVLLDVVVGVDPTVSGGTSGQDAARRLDSVLRAAAPASEVRDARLVDVAAARSPFPPVSSAQAEPRPLVTHVPVDAAPTRPAAPGRAERRADDDEHADQRPAVVTHVPAATTQPTSQPAAQESRPASPPTSQPAAAVPAPSASPETVVRGDTDPSRRTRAAEEPTAPVRRVVPPSHEVMTATSFASADEDVESTRLRPARGKVPELRGDGAEVTVELTDGQRVTFTGTALVGRNPAPRPGEDADHLIRVADPGRSVSKTHLLLGVDRAGLWVKDRDSTNGTVVTLADGQQILCGADQQVRIPPGASVAFGDYGLSVATVDAL
ncbi:RDD family protein [Cellulomonas carbonis]|uniref:Phosphopeptide-binding protein n=1 Tax=Cellulomonas carbonis T26 TaxID=947969 RepID=A0A0A0BQG4_9CELL|nr:RDD family protein [Cellulomonas carbonis]KGM09902.1 phosphopeptide-binding protein [Cellulomonas carbonis T26]GGC09578.1 hypothetical protein GCM10010972_23550 [Cellulomonas carbonis]